MRGAGPEPLLPSRIMPYPEAGGIVVVSTDWAMAAPQLIPVATRLAKTIVFQGFTVILLAALLLAASFDCSS